MAREQRVSTLDPRDTRGSKARHLNLAAVLGMTAAALAAPSAAHAATTFCGGGSFGTRAESVWQAIKNFEQTTQANQSFNRNCLYCHSSTSGLQNSYILTAFEMDILGDWLKSSYWLLGTSKAYSALVRMGMKLMPPGKWPASLQQQPEATHDALRDKIANWINERVPACGTNANCIWGTDRVTDSAADPTGGLQRCSW